MWKMKEILSKEWRVQLSEYEVEDVEEILVMAALKQHFAVYFVGKRIFITNEAPSSETENFPVGLFYRFIDGDSHFGYIKDWNYYNKDHPFSQWLIKNQEELQKQLPEIYERIIKIMLYGKSSGKVKEGINRELKWIQEYKGNFFGVDDDLFLQDEYFG